MPGGQTRSSFHFPLNPITTRTILNCKLLGGGGEEKELKGFWNHTADKHRGCNMSCAHTLINNNNNK